MTIWRFWISDCMIHLLLVFAIDCCVCVCVCERKRERQRERDTGSHLSTSAILIAACVRERERWSHLSTSAESWLVCVCVCVWERERETVTLQRSVQPVKNHLYRGLCANTYELHHCVCHTTLFSSWAWTDDKTKDIINCLYIHFESWSSRLWKVALHFWCSLWCSANHNALGQLANQSRLCLLEGGTL